MINSQDIRVKRYDGSHETSLPTRVHSFYDNTLRHLRLFNRAVSVHER